MHIIELDDLSRPELAPFARLTEAQLRNRRDPEQGLFIAESPKVIEKALDAGCQPVSFLMERRHIDGQGRGLLARCEGVPVYTGDRELLAELTGFALTRGILCAMRRPALPEVSSLQQVQEQLQRGSVDLKELLDEYESAIITEALRQTHRLNAAAEKLSMSPQKLQYRLERLGLKENQKNLIK